MGHERKLVAFLWPILVIGKMKLTLESWAWKIRCRWKAVSQRFSINLLFIKMICNLVAIYIQQVVQQDIGYSVVLCLNNLKICDCYCIRVEFGLLWKFIFWDHSGTYYNHYDTTYTHDCARSFQHFAFLLSMSHVLVSFFSVSTLVILWQWKPGNQMQSAPETVKKMRPQAWSRTVSPYLANKYSSVLGAKNRLLQGQAHRVFGRPKEEQESRWVNSTIFEEFKDIMWTLWTCAISPRPKGHAAGHP